MSGEIKLKLPKNEAYERLGELAKGMPQEKFEEMQKKHGKKFEELAELAGKAAKINVRLAGKVLEKADDFLKKMGEKEIDERAIYVAVKWGNQVLIQRGKEMPILSETLIAEFKPEFAKMEDWQWGQLVELLREFRDAPLAAIYFMDVAAKYAEVRLNWEKFVEMAMRDKDNAIPFICEESDEAKEWLAKEIARRKVAVVRGADMLDELHGFVVCVSHRSLGLVIGKDNHFSTNMTNVFNPEMVHLFDSKEKNRRCYVVSNLHEAGHHRWDSFEVDVGKLNYGAFGWKRAATGKIILEKGEERIEVKDCFDLYKLFPNSAVGQWLHNVLDDGRVDLSNCSYYDGYAEDIRGDNRDLLRFRPDVKGSGAEEIFEALLQLVITDTTKHPLSPELEKKVMPLYEIAKKVRRIDSNATETFNAAIEIYKALEKEIPPPKMIEIPPEGLPGEFRPNKNNPANVRIVESKNAKDGKKGEGGKRDQKEGAPHEFDGPDPKKDVNIEPDYYDSKDGKNNYDEWNYQAMSYRNSFTHVDEVVLPAGEPIEIPLEVSRRIARMFDQMRPVDFRTRRRQEEGDGIDDERLAEYVVERLMGRITEQNFYTKTTREKRSVLVGVLADFSGSHQESIGGVMAIEIGKQAFACVEKGAEITGDRAGVFGFTSSGPGRTEVYVLKPFNGRLSNFKIEPKAANRDGTAIRHVTRKMLREPEKKKVLFVISDCKPNDDEVYKDKYAIEDAAKAVFEARKAGIVTMGIVLADEKERDYEKMMGTAREEVCDRIYGRGRYITISDIRQLPERLTRLYAYLTQ